MNKNFILNLAKQAIKLGALITLGCCLIASPIRADDLLQVYHQATKNDQTLKNALATLRDTAENSPQALALLLPQITADASLGITKPNSTSQTTLSNGITISGNNKYESTDYGINLNQTIFNFSYFAKLGQAHNTVKSAYATYTYAQQTLINRTISTYLDVLRAEDMLAFSLIRKKTLYENLQQAKENFKVGTKTITDYYKAKASYHGAVSSYIADKSALDNALEALSVITGKSYKNLKPVGHIPLTPPNPKHIQTWLQQAKQHNWNIIAADYASLAYKAQIKVARGGHLPTLSLIASYDNNLRSPSNIPSTRNITKSAGIALNVPIFTGGAVSSEVRQAIAQYDEKVASLELIKRQVTEQTKVKYLAIISGISQINADKATVTADESALDATKQGYQQGVNTMLDLLDAEEQLFDDLRTYASDRYSYIENSVDLKQSVGLLSINDVIAINNWLTTTSVLDRYDINIKH